MSDDKNVPPIPPAPAGAAPTPPPPPPPAPNPYTSPNPYAPPAAEPAPNPDASPAAQPAPTPYASPAASAPQAVSVTAPGAKRKVWDIVLTIIFLVFGLFGMFIGVLFGALLPVMITDSGGVVDPVLVPGDQAIIVISHLVLYAAAVGVSILLLVKRKIAFWVPLAAGVLAMLIFWFTFVGAMIASGA